jgi:SET domain-containing protein
MTSQELLEQLSSDTYIALRPSPVHGIGVFAITTIPKGCKTMFSKGVGNWVKLPVADVEKLPAHSRELIETYCLYDEENYFVPDYGFKVMDLVNYLNHSPTPNVISVNDGEYFEALREILTGEELLVNYEAISDVSDYDS